MLGALLTSPEYAAVMARAPAGREAVPAVVLKVARPPLSVPVPSVVAPSLNVTVPVADDGKTVAVKATDCPKVEGFGVAVTVVVVRI